MNPITSTLEQLYGKPCWGLLYDCNTNLHLNFGEPVLEIREPRKGKNSTRRWVTIKGQWRLWVYLSYWKISFAGVTAARSTFSYRQIQIALAELSGQELTRAEINPENGATKWVFDLGGVLETRRLGRTSKGDLWRVYKPDGYILAIRGDGRYSHQRGDYRAEKTFPLPSQL